jgi:acyl carrier protein
VRRLSAAALATARNAPRAWGKAAAEPPHSIKLTAVTRAEISEKLIAIVKKEKTLADDLLQPGTNLAEAGIDSLDSLTILFAIEEEFHISIPDDRARGMKTFGDMIDIVEERVEAS